MLEKERQLVAKASMLILITRPYNLNFCPVDIQLFVMITQRLHLIKKVV